MTDLLDSHLRAACNAASRGSVRLTESKLLDDLEVIMAVPERRTRGRTEGEIKRRGGCCRQVKER